jgi:hypothetical protein
VGRQGDCLGILPGFLKAVHPGAKGRKTTRQGVQKGKLASKFGSCRVRTMRSRRWREWGLFLILSLPNIIVQLARSPLL